MSILTNKILLITGGTGSFGQAVVRRFMNSDIGEIRVFSRHAEGQDAMRQRVKSSKVRYYKGDVCDLSAVDAAMEGVDVVFAAAAMKEVPACEQSPSAAVRTNVLGTENVIHSAVAHHVERVVVLSTDMAVRPLNAMGMTKALMEKMVAVKSGKLDPKGRTVLCCTRHGNLVGSRGSVVPLWMQQLQLGNPLTLTDPGMTRFMMTIDDAVNLVLFALENAQNGDLFVPKAPASTLQTLAEATIKVWERLVEERGLVRSGAPSPEIHVTGRRPGEKLYETMASEDEMARAEDMGGYYRIPRIARSTMHRTAGHTDAQEYNSHITTRLSVEEMMNMLDFEL